MVIVFGAFRNLNSSNYFERNLKYLANHQISEVKSQTTLGNVKMQNDSNFIDRPLKSFINFLNFLLNPNHFLIRDKAIKEYLEPDFDLRSSPNMGILGRKIIYLFRTLFLIFIDNIAIVASWLIISKFSELFIESNPFLNLDGLDGKTLLSAVLVINLFTCFASGIYSTKDHSRRLGEVVTACSLSYLAFFSLLFVLTEVEVGNLVLISTLGITWMLNLGFLCSVRFLVFKTIAYIRNYFSPLRRKVLLVGTTNDIASCPQLFTSSTAFNIVKTLDISCYKDGDYFSAIFEQISSNDLDEVFICSWEKINQQTKLFWNLQTSGISWRILPIKQKIPQQNPELANVEGIPTIRYTSPTIVGIDFLFKRIFDLIVASLLLVILGIPMLFIGLLIKLDSPGSIFYKQARVGLKGEHFKVWKFRTMVENASKLQQELEKENEISGGILFKMVDDPRITVIGKFLRRYSLDELPQLFNVIRGEMSLVGPRPLPIRDVNKFAEHHHFRHEVLPGITGLWQVSGRSDTNSDQVFNLDFQYIENWSLAFDTKILFKTVQVVLLGKGAY